MLSHIWGIFSSSFFSSSVPPSNPSLEAHIPALRPKSQSQGPGPSLEAQIPALNPSGWDLGLKSGIWSSRLGFGLQSRDLGLKAGIWALRLGSESEGRGIKEKEEKIPHMCESITHRPLWGRCPAPPSTLTTTYLGRARVPLTI